MSACYIAKEHVTYLEAREANILKAAQTCEKKFAHATIDLI